MAVFFAAALILLAFAGPSCAITSCTVGPSGAYSTVNAGLLGCNGGVGSYQLALQSGVTFTENLVYPATALNVSIVSEDYLSGLIPAVPFLANITSTISGSNHVVHNTSTALYFLGIGLDGTSNGQPMFTPWLYNNNVTIDRCFISNWTGNFSMRIHPCRRGISISVTNTRWSNVWGSALYFDTMEDVRVTDSICDGCGGFNNFSAFEMKPSYVSQGVFIVRNVSHWLLLDAQPDSCIFAGDRNGMVRCNRGVQECYNAQLTAEKRPNCQKVNMSYIDENDNTTKYIVDYPRECRAYTKCKCADIKFFVNGSQTVVLAIGDLFFSTGLRLNCTVANGTEPLVVLTDPVNVTDPDTNVTTTVNQSDIWMFIGSQAGLDGVGVAPPGGDDGFSLYPNLYIEGSPDNTTLNCTCPPTVNQSALSLGLSCDYPVIAEQNITCSNGLVGTCSYEFLLCYNVTDTVVRFLLESNGIADETTANDMLCEVNGTIFMANESDTGTPCSASLTTNFTSGWQLNLVGSSLACLGNADVFTQYTVLFQDLSAVDATALCSTEPHLIAQGCPPLPTDQGPASFNLTCDSCFDAFESQSRYALARVCVPYRCPAVYNITCRYYFDGNGSVSLTHTIYSEESYTDGRTYDGTGNLWSNGDLVCNETDPDEAEWQDKQCLQQVFHGFECNPANSTLILAQANLTTEYPSNHTSTCGADYVCVSPELTTCSCDIGQMGMCLAPYNVGRFAAGFHIDNLHKYLSFVDVSYNRAQQLYLGLRLDRTAEAVIFNASTFTTGFSDQQARLRELWTPNYQIEGALHDFMYGLPDDDTNIAAYRYFCDDGCAVPFTTEEEFDCIVDASIPADQVAGSGGGPSFYQEIQLADDDECETVVVRNYESFYTENLNIQHIKKLYSLPDQGAVLLGNNHQIDVDNFDIRGIIALHPGDEPVPLFVPKQDMDTFWIRNCDLDGGGVRGAGILPLNLKKLIDHFVVNSTRLGLWNYALLIMKQAKNVELAHNTIQDSYGRLVDVRYSGVFRMIENVILNCRGTGDGKGVPLIRFMANDIITFGGITISSGEVHACSDDAVKEFGLPCTFYSNVQQKDLEMIADDDFGDACYMVVGGLIGVDQIFDNVCYKAGVGFVLRQIPSITTLSIPDLLIRNAMIRPSNFRTTARANKVVDWQYERPSLGKGLCLVICRYDEYFTSNQFPVFVPFATRKCNYNCGLNAVFNPVCTVNANFQFGYAGAASSTYSIYGQQAISSVGFGIYPNFSLAGDFCDITRTNPYTGAIERPVYCQGDQGGGLFYDSFNITKAGVSFYGALLPNESNIPSACFPRCQVHGDGFLLLGNNFTSCNMSWMRTDAQMDIDTHMFSTLPDTQVIYNVNFTNNTFSAGNLPAYSGNQVLRIVTDIDEDRYIAQNKQRGGRRPKVLSQQPTSTVIIVSNIFEDFATYSTNLVDPIDHEQYNTTLGDFPFTDPIYIQFQNKNPNMSNAIITNNTFYRVDHRSIDLRYCSNAIIAGNIFADVGSRSPGNSAGIMIAGSDINPSNLTFADNLIYRLRPVLSDTTNSQVNPGFYANVWVAGYQNGSRLCIENNTISGGAIGMRFSGMNITVLESCINKTVLPGFLDDGLDPLRDIWFYNRNITGYVQCIVFGNPHDDFFHTWRFCCDGCFDVSIDACNVSLTNSKYGPWNPFFDSILFNDLDLAITNCTHPSGRIRMLLNSPTSVTYSFAQPIQFPAGHAALDPTGNFSIHLFADEQSSAAVPVVVTDCGIQFVNGRLIVEGLEFSHNCGATLPTWLFNTADPSPDPRQLTLLSNNFVGNSATQSALSGTIEDGWVIGDAALNNGTGQTFYHAFFNSQQRAIGRGNTFSGYLGDRVVDLAGRNCSVSVRVWFNDFERCEGACLALHDFGGISADFNYFFNGVATSSTENAAAHISVCMPLVDVPYVLDVQWNQLAFDTSIGGYNPDVNNAGGYITGIWVDPTPNKRMKTTIKHNRGDFPGVCLRVDNKTVNFAVTDPQSDARHISVHDMNIYCQGGKYDIRLQNGPSYDPTVDSDHILFRAYFCNDGCSHTTDAQLAMILAIPLALFLMVVLGGIFYCATRGSAASIYFSGVMGDYLWINPSKWEKEGVYRKLRRKALESVGTVNT